MAATS
jgi:putative transposase